MNVLSNETVSVVINSVSSVCEGTSVEFTATPTNGGSSPSYEWFVNGALQNGATAATFTYTPLIGEVVSVELTSNLACALNTEATATSNLTINTTPSIQLISQSNPSSCGALDGEINISVTPAITGTYRFDYTVGGQVYSPLITITNGNATIVGGAGNYTNISLDLNGCTSSNTLSASLTDPAAIAFTVGQAVNPTSCNGTNGSFTISGLDSDESYSLVYNSNSPMNITSDNTGAFVVDNLTAGSYSNFTIQINGCTSTNSTVVSLLNPTAPLMPSTGVNEYNLCQNDDEITLQVTGEVGSVFTWYAEDQTTIIGTGTTYVPSTENGQTIYYVTQTLNSCESNQLAITVSITATPEAPNVTDSREYCSQDAIAPMEAEGAGGAFYWYLDAELNEVHTEGEIVYPTNTIGTVNYFVTQVINGCESEASQIVITVQECGITLPTAFTPNGDGINDTWEILELDELYPLNIVRIYNRWGTLIFEHSSLKDGPYYKNEWNGRYNGVLLPTGSYYFVIEFNNVAKDTEKGTVTLILD
jgi:gliding motility-associated-like protein